MRLNYILRIYIHFQENIPLCAHVDEKHAPLIRVKLNSNDYSRNLNVADYVTVTSFDLIDHLRL